MPRPDINKIKNRLTQHTPLLPNSNEIYKNRDFYAAAVDVWALGVILFIMLTGIPPVETPAEIDPRFRMLQEGRLFELMDLWKVTFLSEEARDLLKGMLQVDPRARLSTDQIKAHPWLAGPIAAALLEGGAEGQGQQQQQQQQEDGGQGQGGGAGGSAAATDSDAMSI